MVTPTGTTYDITNEITPHGWLWSTPGNITPADGLDQFPAYPSRRARSFPRQALIQASCMTKRLLPYRASLVVYGKSLNVATNRCDISTLGPTIDLLYRPLPNGKRYHSRASLPVRFPWLLLIIYADVDGATLSVAIPQHYPALYKRSGEISLVTMQV